MEGFTYYQLTNWSACDQAIYQQDVVIHRTTGTAYQETVGGMKVWHIYVGTHCKADYGDIRFTDGAGTELAYYLWSDHTSSSARFCVRLEGADAAGVVTIWYGNAVATTTSDGSGTYLFFDQFDTFRNDVWSVTEGAPPTVSGSVASLVASCTIRTKSTVPIINTRVEVRSQFTSGYRFSVGESGYDFLMDAPPGSTTYPLWRLGTTKIVSKTPYPPVGSWSVFWVNYGPTSAAAGWDSNSIITCADTPPDSGSISMRHWYQQTHRVDYVLVRAYSATPPAATAFSGELQPITAAFSASPTTGTASITTIAFTDQSTGSPTSWSWNFGDGSTSTVRNPTHIYVTPGTYTVSLTAANAGSSNIVTKTNYVTVNPNLVGGKNVLYAAERSATGSGTGWATPAVSFAPVNMNGLTKANGMLKIDLKVSRDNDATVDGTNTDQVCIELTSSGKCDTNEWSRYYQNSELTTSYKTFYIPLSTFVTAGGELNTGAINYIRVFSKSKTGQGLTVYWRNAEIYLPATEADFTVESSVVLVGQAVPFIDTSQYTPTSWLWDFGDRTTSTEQNPTHTYTTPGTYTVTLTASNASGEATVTKTNVIHVFPVLGDPIKINFQPQIAETPYGYNYDYGQTYRNMGNEWSWGWSVDTTEYARERNVNSDQRYDTFIFIPSSDTRKWEIGLPNGYYTVRISIGDAANTQTNTLVAEGVQYWNEYTTTSNEFSTNAELVQVTNGKLTLTNNGLGTGNTCINYIEIIPIFGSPISLNKFKNQIELTLIADNFVEDLTDFPVMIKLSETSGISMNNVSRIFDELESDTNRKKIAITDMDGDPLFVEIKEWNTVTKTAYLWAKVPNISSTKDTILYLYYDKNVPDNTLYVGDTGEVAAQQVWANGHEFVGLKPSGGQLLDSSPNGNHGTIYGATEVDGPLGTCLSFDGVDDYISAPGAAPTDPSSGSASILFTRAWATNDDETHGLMCIGGYVSGKHQDYKRLQMFKWSGNNLWYFRLGDDSSFAQVNVPDSEIPADVLTYVTMTWANGLVSVYVNGVVAGTFAKAAPLTWLTNHVELGRAYQDDVMHGQIMGARVSSVARSPAWIAATDLSLKDELIVYKEIAIPRGMGATFGSANMMVI